MVKIILNGCSGKMGEAVTACVADRDDAVITAGVDLNTSVFRSYPVFDSFSGELRRKSVHIIERR